MNVVSLFAGCGGLDKGFEDAGFKVVWANEYDSSIFETYRFNHPKTILNTSDIRTLTGNDIPECDGIIGGPPCQSWSEGGKRLGIDDPRGQLFFDYIRIVKEKQPKFFVIENVQGILDAKHKDALDFFLKLLSDAGYHTKYELLNAADYRIPQDRFRVFFVGLRKDLDNNFAFPDASCNTPITLKQAIGDIIEEPRYFIGNSMDGNNPVRLNHDTYSGPFDEKFMSRNRVRTWDEPSFTIQALAKNAPIHPRAPKMTFVSPSQRIFAKGYEHLYRRLSVRECARIQTFPDSFRFFYEDVRNGYKMVGNAVPPRLAWYLAIQLKKAFGETISTSDKKSYTNDIRKVSVNSLTKESIGTLAVNNYGSSQTGEHVDLKLDANVLVCYVKPEYNIDYLNRTANFYYTGHNFPSSVVINKMHYFIPYLKGKGIKDLYLIKVVRVGTKKDMIADSTDNTLRLIFEIEFIAGLFEDYKPIHLNVWHTFSDTKLSEIVKIIHCDE